MFRAKAFGVEGFERIVAVKRILPAIAADEEFISMFIDEAKIAVQFNHPNICQIFDLGKVEESYFIALEFVHGRDLRSIFDRCRQRPVDGSQAMPIPQAAFIVMKACEGLDYAHNKRDAQGRELHLVHRDVSPQNILISYEGDTKLIDFGIAKAAGKVSKTQQGILKGKFGYMSPEQVRGLPLDRRSDVFSLGIVLYELLTGERLFVGESDFATLEKVRNVEILPPSTYNRAISDELERIVLKALAKDVEDRYQSAIDLHDDLQAFLYSAGQFYSRKDLMAWMKRHFASEIAAEEAKLEAFRQMPAPRQVNGRPLGESNRPRRLTKPPGAAMPATMGQKPGEVRAAAASSQEVQLAWDEEELATNIYDQPGQADSEAELAEFDLGAENSTSPLAVVTVHAPPVPAAAPAGRAAAAPPRWGAMYGLVAVLAVLLVGVAVWLLSQLLHAPAEVVISSLPPQDIQLSVNGKPLPISSTPAAFKLEPGTYSLLLKRPGYKAWSEQITVKSGELLRRSVTLEAEGAGFRLHSEPPGLLAELDGRPLAGVTPLQVQGLQPGKHQVTVKDKKGEAWSEAFELTAGAMIDVHATLPTHPPPSLPTEVSPPAVAMQPEEHAPRPAPPRVSDDTERSRPAPERAVGEGFMRIGSKPWTHIAIDGKDTGLHTPQTQMRLAPGAHQVVLSNPEFRIKESFSVEIRNGETTTVIKDLNPTAPSPE